jgi:hypothetical protein
MGLFKTRKILRFRWAAIAVLLMVSPDVCFALQRITPMPPKFRIQYAKGRLSMQVRNVPVNRVLDQISECTGIKIRYSASATLPVTLSFENLPLDEAIKRLVSNDAMLYVTGPQPHEFSLTEVTVTDTFRTGQPVHESRPRILSVKPLQGDPTESLLQAQEASDYFESTGGGCAIPHQLIVRFRKGITENQIESFLGDTGAV